MDHSQLDERLQIWPVLPSAKRPHRLAARTADSQFVNRGSIPREGTSDRGERNKVTTAHPISSPCLPEEPSESGLQGFQTLYPMIRAIRCFLAVCTLLFLCPSGFTKGSHGGHGHSHSEKSGSDVHVRGYFRKDGTYVQEHMRSAPDGDKSNNWSTKGNVNPYTGKVGTKNIYPETRSPSPRAVRLDPPPEVVAVQRHFSMPSDPVRSSAWRSVQKDMTPSQLRTQLGEPKSITQTGGADDWHYEDGVVRISNDAANNVVQLKRSLH
jgi:hypothetical protein